MIKTFQSSSCKEEIQWIHFLRVLACAMVVALHTLPPSNEFNCEGIDATYRHLMLILTKPCVPLFFMITGYLILPYEDNDFVAFYKKRIPRVLFPLLFWGIVYAILPWMLNMCDYKEMIWELLLSPVKSPNLIGGVLWYLFILIGIYLSIPYISSSFYENKMMQLTYFLIWLVASFVTLICHYCDNNLPFVLGLNYYEHNFDMTIYFSGYLGYILLGYAFKRNSFSLFKSMGGGIVSIIIFLFIACLSVKIPLTCSFLAPGTLLMSYIIFSLISNISIKTKGYKMLKVISKCSFGVYLSHMAIFRLITINVYYHYGTSLFLQFLVFVLSFIGSLLFVCIFNCFKLKKYLIG